MTALLCEPSDRIGSNFEPQRPNSHIIQERRSGFLPPPAGALSGDGADQIKAHPWFKGIDFSTIHLERAPYQPEMRDPADTRHFVRLEPLSLFSFPLTNSLLL
jgi:protein-serine/threonine kinase